MMDSMFVRRSTGNELGPMKLLGHDESMLTSSEAQQLDQVRADIAGEAQQSCCPACAEKRCLDPCVNGFRTSVSTTDGTTRVEPCTSDGSQSSGLTDAQKKQLAEVLAAFGLAAAKALLESFQKKTPPPPPPAKKTLIPGIPNVVTLGAVALVVVLVVFKFRKK